MRKIRIYQLVVGTLMIVGLIISIAVLRSKIVATNIFLWGLALILVPSGIYNYITYKRMKEMEEQLPRFLRGISEFSKSGMNLYESFKRASKEDYGILTKELRKIVSEASWNVGMDRAIRKFISRTESKRIRRIMFILLQAYKSGGDITRITESLAANMEKIKEIENRKKTLMSQHVTMIYAVFFIFIGISLLLLKFMMPMLTMSKQMSATGFGFTFGIDPCDVCTNPVVCAGCPIFNSVCIAFGLGDEYGISCYYKGLFFTMIFVQAIFSGLICGVIESNSLRAGIKHSILMSLSGVFVFLIAGWLGII